jgi:hypothetical protein
VAVAGAEHALAGQVAAAGEGSVTRSGGAWRALAAAARQARTPAEERALAVLAVLTAQLREAQHELARLDVVPGDAALVTTPRDVAPAGRADRATRCGGGRRGGPPRLSQSARCARGMVLPSGKRFPACVPTSPCMPNT